MEKDRLVPLHDMLEAVAGIHKAVYGMTFETYSTQRLIRRAVEREIEILSEASRRLSPTFKKREPSVPWCDIAGIGNILWHDYERVSDRIIWNVVVEHLPTLEAALHRLLASEQDINSPR